MFGFLYRSPSRLSVLLISFIALMDGSFVSAQTDPAQSTSCRRITEKIVSATGATIINRTVDEVIFIHPLTKSMRLSCARHNPIGVTIEAINFNPPVQWFGLTAVVGEAVTGAKRERTYDAVYRCIKKAAISGFFAAPDQEVTKAKIDCHVHTRELPSTYAQIWMDDEQPSATLE